MLLESAFCFQLFTYFLEKVVALCSIMEFPWNQISAIENRPYIELYVKKSIRIKIFTFKKKKFIYHYIPFIYIYHIYIYHIYIYDIYIYHYINQYTARDTVGKGYGDLAANIGPISEKPFTNTISNQSF